MIEKMLFVIMTSLISCKWYTYRLIYLKWVKF